MNGGGCPLGVVSLFKKHTQICKRDEPTTWHQTDSADRGFPKGKKEKKGMDQLNLFVSYFNFCSSTLVLSINQTKPTCYRPMVI